MIQKYGTAHWEGGIKDGRGRISTETGSLTDQAYGFAQRFEGVRGSNPEELLGAAHAACYAMAMSLGLEKAGRKATAIDARSTISLEPQGEGFAITRAHLEVTASVPGMSAEEFAKVAEDTKNGCPVSKVLAGADITMSARLA